MFQLPAVISAGFSAPHGSPATSAKRKLLFPAFLRRLPEHVVIEVSVSKTKMLRKKKLRPDPCGNEFLCGHPVVLQKSDGSEWCGCDDADPAYCLQSQNRLESEIDQNSDGTGQYREDKLPQREPEKHGLCVFADLPVDAYFHLARLLSTFELDGGQLSLKVVEVVDVVGKNVLGFYLTPVGFLHHILKVSYRDPAGIRHQQDFVQTAWKDCVSFAQNIRCLFLYAGVEKCRSAELSAPAADEVDRLKASGSCRRMSCFAISINSFSLIRIPPWFQAKQNDSRNWLP